MVKAPVANVAPPSLDARAMLDAVTSPFATACAFWAIILSNTFLACLSLTANSANSAIVNESVELTNPQFAKVSDDTPATLVSCYAVYFELTEDSATIVAHWDFCSSVNSLDDSNTFCWATSNALNDVNNWVVLPVLFKTVDIFVNCCLNIVLLYLSKVLWRYPLFGNVEFPKIKYCGILLIFNNFNTKVVNTWKNIFSLLLLYHFY